MDDLSVCVGIDAGSSESKLSYADAGGTRIIARLPGFELGILREEAESYFDEPVFSCVVASDSSVRAGNSGFVDVNTIAQSEAVILALGRESRSVVYDLGEEACKMYVVDGGELVDSVKIDDVCGRVIDSSFTEYLTDRFMLNANDSSIIHEIRRIKHSLTENEITSWREIEISRYELDRTLHFAVKRTARVLQRLVNVYKPEGVVLTGGSVNIPEVRRVIAEVIGREHEYRRDLIAEGAATKALELQKDSRRNARKLDTSARLRELRAGMLALEDKLTRKQKDRVYSLFRQAEGINDAGIITLIEKMLREIRSV